MRVPPKRDWLWVSSNRGPKLDTIMDAIIDETRVARREMHSEFMDRRITEARAIFYHIAHEFGGHSWGTIAQYINRDPSTATKQGNRVKFMPSLQPVLGRIKRRLGVYGGPTVKPTLPGRRPRVDAPRETGYP